MENYIKIQKCNSFKIEGIKGTFDFIVDAWGESLIFENKDLIAVVSNCSNVIISRKGERKAIKSLSIDELIF